MIEEIALLNFQSHQDVVLEFCPGINVIKGSSDQGKTSILRGLNWCVNNRPIGTSMNSKWNKSEKKKFLSDHSVRVKTNGRYVHRIRNEDFNGYKIFDDRDKPRGDTIDAVGSDVPEQITEVFNLSEVNIQKQLANPFLISESPAEVARFLNKIIRLDLIDKVLGSAEQKRKQTNKDILRVETEIKDVEEKIKDLAWVEEAQDVLEMLKRRTQRCEKNRDDLLEVGILVDSYETQEDVLEKLAFLEEAEELAGSAEDLDKQIDEKINESNKVFDLVESWELNQKVVDSSQNFDEAIVLMDEAERINTKLSALDRDEEDVTNLIFTYEQNIGIITECKKEIKGLTKSLPADCPYCNQKLPDSMEVK